MTATSPPPLKGFARGGQHDSHSLEGGVRCIALTEALLADWTEPTLALSPAAEETMDRTKPHRRHGQDARLRAGEWADAAVTDRDGVQRGPLVSCLAGVRMGNTS